MVKQKKCVFDDPMDAPMYLPVGFYDYTYVCGDFSPIYMVNGLEAVFVGCISEPPTTSFKNGKPRTKFSLTDGRYFLRFTMFGDLRVLVQKIQDASSEQLYYVHGQIVIINDRAYINTPKFIDESDASTIKPQYPSIPRKIKAEAMSSYMAKAVRPHIQDAAKEIRNVLMKLYSQRELKKLLQIKPGVTLESILEAVHYPTDIEYAWYALGLLTRIATILAASDLVLMAKADKGKVEPLLGPEISALSKNLKFKLTDEQEAIVERCITRIKKGEVLDTLIFGDVGTGKTVVYSMISAYVAHSGGRVAIMLPNGNLAQQIFQEFTDLYPNLKTLLVMSEETNRERIASSEVLIGTTALLYRELGQIHLGIFDESQKMAMEQQVKIAGQGVHRISVSATPIPRTMALAKYGGVTTERITKCHVQKTIYTRILTKNDFQTMVDEIMWAILDAGKQAIVVCARKEDALVDTESNAPDVISVQEAFSYFDSLLPNQVVMSHSGLLPEENKASLDAMRNGQAKLLVATTVIEVGVTLPDVVMLVVLNPERYGLGQLHQLRGRVSRAGGEGWFTILTEASQSQKAINRLQALVESSDGYYLAKKDMLLRGAGDILGAKTQHGPYLGLVKNADINLAEVDSIVQSLVG